MPILVTIGLIIALLIFVKLLPKSKDSGFVNPVWDMQSSMKPAYVGETDDQRYENHQQAQEQTIQTSNQPRAAKGQIVHPIMSFGLAVFISIVLIVVAVITEIWLLPLAIIITLVLIVVLPSFYYIPPLHFAMARRLFSLAGEAKTVVSFKGEAGFDHKLIYNGVRFRWWFLYRLTLWPYGSVPQDEMALVIFQVGAERPGGQKTADVEVDDSSGDIDNSFRQMVADPKKYLEKKGQSGPSRHILKPGDPFAYHPAACLVILQSEVLGIPLSAEAKVLVGADGKPNLNTLGLQSKDLQITHIKPTEENVDMCGIVTILDGPPPPSGAIASRAGGWEDLDLDKLKEREKILKGKENLTDEEKKELEKLEKYTKELNDKDHGDEKRRDRVLRGSDEFVETQGYQRLTKFYQKNLIKDQRWMNYAGLQVDTLVEGNYLLNPLVVKVRQFPMLTVREGWVAGIISNVGLAEEDISGQEFEHGTIVKWGYKGIQNLPLRPRKYALNPSCFTAILFRTAITTLELIDEDGTEFDHKLDANFADVTLTTKDGYQPKVGVIIQFSIKDKFVPTVMQRFSTMPGLVNQAVVPIVTTRLGVEVKKRNLGEFIEQTAEILTASLDAAKEDFKTYEVNLIKIAFGPKIKNIPPEFEKVRTAQTIATEQEKAYKLESGAEKTRIELETNRGTADASHEVSYAEQMIKVQENWSKAYQKLSEGVEVYRHKSGNLAADELGKDLAKAMAMMQQKVAIGEKATALLSIVQKLADAGIEIVPKNLVISGDASGMLSSLIGQLSGFLQNPSDEDKKSERKAFTVKKDVKKDTEISKTETTEQKSETKSSESKPESKKS